jgi:hypothetical protein
MRGAGSTAATKELNPLRKLDADLDPLEYAGNVAVTLDVLIHVIKV